jgi:hypothetical protein
VARLRSFLESKLFNNDVFFCIRNSSGQLFFYFLKKVVPVYILTVTIMLCLITWFYNKKYIYITYEKNFSNVFFVSHAVWFGWQCCAFVCNF